MPDTRHFGLIGGLGVGAAVLYYEGITRACSDRGAIPRMTIAHANAPTALDHVQKRTHHGTRDTLATFDMQSRRIGETLAPRVSRSPPSFERRIFAEGVEGARRPVIIVRHSTSPAIDFMHGRARLRRRSSGTVQGTVRFTIDSRLFGALDDLSIVRPRDAEVDEIHRIYLDLAQKARCTPEDIARLRDIATTLCSRDQVEAIVLAGTDLNLIFDEATAGFPAVDCAAAHITAIVDEMCGA